MAPTRRGLLAGVAVLVPVASTVPLAVLPAAPDALLLALCATFHAHQDAAEATASDDDTGLTAAQARGWEVQQRIRDIPPATPAGQAAKAHVAVRLLEVTEGPAWPGGALDLAMTTLAEVAGVAPRAAEELRGAAKLPNPDAELIALCRFDTARSARFDALWADYMDVVRPPAWVRAESDALVTAGHAAENDIANLPAQTMTGLRAKAEALKGHWGDDPGINSEYLAHSLLDDVLRLLPAGGGA